MRRFLSIFPLILWSGLLLFWGKFWVAGPFLKDDAEEGKTKKRSSKSWPKVAVIVPGRDEEELLPDVLPALLNQNYPGDLEIIFVDDESVDGSVAVANKLIAVAGANKKRGTVVKGLPRPTGWSGKLWAVHQGEKQALKNVSDNDFVLLTDADIVHDKDHVRLLVEKAQRSNLDMVSEMVKLRCDTFWEKLFIPAFVYFFAFLYPFRMIGDPKSKIAGAAGGTILLKVKKLKEIGGVESLREALIDDCTLATRVKNVGGHLYLGLSENAWSIRPYRGVRDIWNMITRTAYVQLKYSPILLFGTLIGMFLMWVAPLYGSLFFKGKAKHCSRAALFLSCSSIIPTLKWFNLSPWRAALLPFVAYFYSSATFASAVKHYRGQATEWRGRAYVGKVNDE